MSKSELRSEILRVYTVVTLITVAVTTATGALVREFGHLVLSGSFLFGALWLARRHPTPSGPASPTREGPRGYGIDLSGVLEPRRDAHGAIEPMAATARRALIDLARELGIALLVALLVFPPFILAYRVLHQVDQPFTLHLPSRPLDFALGQLVIVALPEEALFRGYFQTRLGDYFPARVRVAGVEIAPAALLVQAALFGLLHFAVGFAPARLAVFFPGLLFGLLRAWRGGIGAGTWFHALSNILAELLARGYL